MTPQQLVEEGRRLQREDRNSSALAAFDRALALEPDFPLAWAAKALLFEDLERFDESLAAWDRVVALTPDDSGAWSNRAGVLLRLERLEDGLASIGRALQLDPGNTLLAFNRSLLLWHGLGRAAEALPGLEQAAAAGLPEAAEALAELRVFCGFSADSA